MHRNTILFRLASVTATIALTVAIALPPFARAQDGGNASPAADQQEASPPARVGAITLLTGTVSFHAAGADSWDPAALNYPLMAGTGVWTQPGAGTRIGISDTRIVLSASTDLEIRTLDERSFVASLPQGEAYVRVRSLLPGETYTLVTPRGAVGIAEPGRYVVVAGDTATPTLVTVLEGAATLSEGAETRLGAGQAVQVAGGQAPFQLQVAAATRDAFVNQVLAMERPAPVQAAAAPPLVTAMPGGAELAEYGSWQRTPDYGEVWYPQVRASWVPYREGHWAYVPPWGWTWVDDAPWGFAPFHYGRWIQLEGRWCWAPGEAQVAHAEAPPYPVYAPALVTFFGVGLAAGAAAGITARSPASGSVGWVPLGPREAYRPWFNAAPAYVRDVNLRHVSDVSQITTVISNRSTVNNVTVNQFRNVAGATVVSAAAMAMSRPIAAAARPVTPQALAQAHPVVGRQVAPPPIATPGVAPAPARRAPFAPAPAGVPGPPRFPAPGPVIRAQAQQAVPVRPELLRAEPPAAAPPNAFPPAAPPLAAGPAAGHAEALPRPGKPEAVQAGPHAAPGLPTLRAPALSRPERPVAAGAAAGVAAPQGPGTALPAVGAPVTLHTPAPQQALPLAAPASRLPAPTAAAPRPPQERAAQERSAVAPARPPVPAPVPLAAQPQASHPPPLTPEPHPAQPQAPHPPLPAQRPMPQAPVHPQAPQMPAPVAHHPPPAPHLAPAPHEQKRPGQP